MLVARWLSVMFDNLQLAFPSPLRNPECHISWIHLDCMHFYFPQQQQHVGLSCLPYLWIILYHGVSSFSLSLISIFSTLCPNFHFHFACMQNSYVSLLLKILHFQLILFAFSLKIQLKQLIQLSKFWPLTVASVLSHTMTHSATPITTLPSSAYINPLFNHQAQHTPCHYRLYGPWSIFQIHLSSPFPTHLIHSL